MPVEIKNVPLAFYLHCKDVRAVLGGRGVGKRLPTSLVISPGRYRIHGRTYTLNREGLYRFIFPGQSNHQRIVYRRDIFALLSAIAWLGSHGTCDDLMTLKELRRQALAGKLIVTCGKISDFGHELLTGLGLRSRRVATKTLTELNDYDTGHQLLEVWLDGRWTLVDLDLKKLFRRRGQRLSLLEFHDAAAIGDFQLESLSAATALAIGGFSEGGYDYCPLAECSISTEAMVRSWYRKIVTVPIQLDQGRWFTTDTEAMRRKFERSYPNYHGRYLPKAEFIERFYPPSQGVLV